MADASAVREITDRLETGVKELFESEKYAAYLQTMSRFHNYSTRNTLLIHMQYPQASKVAGFRGWQQKFNRHVKKGEHGIKIFAPIPFVVKEEIEKLDPVTKKPVLDENGQPVMEEYIKAQSARFKIVNVFDIAQTDGEPLPELAETLTGNVEQYELFLDTLREVSPLPIVFEDLPPDTDGRCIFGERIAIRNGMSEIQTVSAVIHEITHAKLHDIEVLRRTDENTKPKDRRTEEVEAESVSFAVNQYYSIDTGANSFGYIAEWSRGRELKELNASLDIIRKTAAGLIDSIDAQYRTLAKERGIDLSAEAPEREADSPASQTDIPEQEPYIRGGLNNDAQLIAIREKYGEKSYEYETIRREMQLSLEKYGDILSHLNTELNKRGYSLEDAEYNSQDYLNDYIDEVDYQPAENDVVKIADFIVARVNLPKEPALESVDSEPPDNPGIAEIINGYARNARVSDPQRIGASVLMAPVFIDGNFNRAMKKTHVTVEEPIGKYQVFSRDEGGDKNLYFLTASGMIDRISEYYRDQWNEEQGKWVSYRPSEAELDDVIKAVSERFERDLAQPDEWAKYQHAAILNRIDECEKHNEPVRELREQERKAEAEEMERKAQEEARLKEEKYNARIDEIESAIKSGETIKVGYSADDFGGRNPVLDLFKRHGIALPLKTQGWVNSGLAEITAENYRYYTSKHGGDSTTFSTYLDKLRDAIKTAHIEQSKQETSILAESATLDMSVPDPLTSNETMREYGYDSDNMLPMSNLRAVELFDTQHTIYLLYADNTEAMAYDREEVLQHKGLCGIDAEDWKTSPIYMAQMKIVADTQSVYNIEPTIAATDVEHTEVNRTADITAPPPPATVEISADTADKKPVPDTTTPKPQQAARMPAPKGRPSIMSRLTQAKQIVENSSRPGMPGNMKEMRE